MGNDVAHAGRHARGKQNFASQSTWATLAGTVTAAVYAAARRGRQLRCPHVGMVGLHLVVATMACLWVEKRSSLAYGHAAASSLVAAVGAPWAAAIAVRRGAAGLQCALGAMLPVLPGLGLVVVAAHGAVRQQILAAAFGALLPLATAAYGALLGAAVETLGRRYDRVWRNLGIGVVVVAPLAALEYRLFAAPPVASFDHLWGYFAAVTYGEVPRLDSRLWALRAGTLLRIAGLLAVVAAGRAGRQRAAVVTLCGVSALAMIYDKVIGPRALYRVNLAQIRAQLPVEVERAGIVVHLPAATSVAEQAQVADLHADALAAVVGHLKVVPSDRIHSFVFADGASKSMFLGAAESYAKPWLRQLYVQRPDATASLLRHELAHVVAGEFGSQPLRISARAGVLVYTALVEGLAEAVATAPGRLHEAARTMRAGGALPDLRRCLGMVGFWQEDPARAYAAAGSFVRFLIDTYGVDRLRQAYAHADFRGAYGVNLEVLVMEWHRVLDAWPPVDAPTTAPTGP